MENAIETHDLTKYYGKSPGIEKVNLTVRQGEIFGFIGPNGAGKSTTIRTLLGLIRPTRGRATIFGKDITREGPELRESVGYLPSEVFYYDGMKVIDLLRYSASFYHKPKRDIETRMRELAELLDLDLNRKIDDLSYGNKKKVGIVQGLQHSPKLIILDEPTGGLDPLVQANFFDLLRQENQRGKTVLFSSHILSEVQKLCDRVAIIKNGHLIETQSVKELRKNTYLRCRIGLTQKPARSTFDKPNISGLVITGKTVDFIFKGDVNQLTKILASLPLESINIDEPGLEEIFMSFYQKSPGHTS